MTEENLLAMFHLSMRSVDVGVKRFVKLLRIAK